MRELEIAMATTMLGMTERERIEYWNSIDGVFRANCSRAGFDDEVIERAAERMMIETANILVLMQSDVAGHA